MSVDASTLGAMQADGNTRGALRIDGTTGSFLALSLVWGASFLFIKLGLRGFSPTQLVLCRILIGAFTLAVKIGRASCRERV